jgi:hypothetical protein
MNSLSPDSLAEAQKSLLVNLILPEGKRFRPDWPVTRCELAAVFVRAGSVPQYLAANPLYSDVKDISTRNVIESVQSSPNGKLFVDASDKFYPYSFSSKLVTAIAMVKAANLDGVAGSSVLSPAIADYSTIPSQWRGYVAIALQKGFISLDGNRFNPNRSITRIELARSINTLIQ